ncbi:MAG: hypothetical protein M9962_09135 [Oligoflexia bacterium]|nr:hypothetical protein [Oligoflexia bacterium]
MLKALLLTALLLFSTTVEAKQSYFEKCKIWFTKLVTPSKQKIATVVPYPNVWSKISAKYQSEFLDILLNKEVRLLSLSESKVDSIIAKANLAKNSEEFRYLFLSHFFKEKNAWLTDQIIKDSWPLVEKNQDRFALGYALGKSQFEYRGLEEIWKLERIRRAKLSNREFVKKITEWTKSPIHARYLYDNLNIFKPKESLVLDYLIHNNEYFKRVGRVRGPPNTLVTLSFEKETRDKNITLLYKHPKYTDEDWLKISEAEREKILLDTIKGTKQAQAANIVAPTEFLPEAAGGVTREPLPAGEKPLFEFAHKSYDIDPDYMLSQMDEVSKAFKENDFHAHLVFELPEKYSQMNEFRAWLKQSNDYLYFSGLENGLHAHKFTQLKSVKGYPKNLEEISKENFKFMTLGVRRGLYGSAKNSGYAKLGIELRDVTRNMDDWRKYIHEFHKSVSGKVWEKGPSNLDNFFQIDPDDVTAIKEMLVAKGYKKEFVERVAKAEPTFMIPFMDFENARVFDYQTGLYRSADPEMAKRVSEAREVYLDEMKKVELEIDGILAKGESLADEDVSGAVRYDLSMWAKRAQVSSLFSGI